MFVPEPLLRSIIKSGRLNVIDAGGKRHSYGDGTGDRPVTIRFRDRAAEWKLALQPQLQLGQVYMDGGLTVEDAGIYDFLDLVTANLGWGWGHWLGGLAARTRLWSRRMSQWNRRAKARRNVAHHYDLSGALYDLFLDEDRQYSCAYFVSPDDGLDQAQANKCRHIASKLLLKPGQRILDIGSGWGGLALHLARVGGGQVDGITLSQEQLRYARARAEASGISDRLSFNLRDYREIEGRYDRIVSVGMFEHVGVGYYRTFFRKVRALLADDGVALLHAIGRADGPGATNPWVRKYIFPGGYTPALSEVLPAIERSGLLVTDIEILRLHYAETLRHWRNRFRANWDRAAALYDERFCRMWEFYLAGSEAAFRHSGLMVFQIQLARSLAAVPIRRDYMVDWERAQIAGEAAGAPRRRAQSAAAMSR
jgi:cyclopropane-fatty-acyl-phospholipid synthase